MLFRENRKCKYGLVFFGDVIGILPFKDIGRNGCQKEAGNQYKNEQKVVSHLINQKE